MSWGARPTEDRPRPWIRNTGRRAADRVVSVRVDRHRSTVNSTHRSLRAVAAALAIATIAALVPTALGPSAAAAAPSGPCGALGKLYPYTLNDRCDFGSVDAPETLDGRAVVAGLQAAGLFATTQECNGAVVPVVARPDALLVTADNRGLLDEAIAK